MAASVWFFYVAAIEAFFEGNIDADLTNNLRITLVTASYTPNRHTHDTWSDVSGNEVANGNGYSTHGKPLISVTVATLASPSDVIAINCDDVSWTSASFTAKYAVIVEDGNQDLELSPGDRLVAYCDLNYGAGSISPTNGTLLIRIADDGIVAINQTG